MLKRFNGSAALYGRLFCTQLDCRREQAPMLPVSKILHDPLPIYLSFGAEEPSHQRFTLSLLPNCSGIVVVRA